MLALFASEIHSDLLARCDSGSVPLLTVNCDSADLPAPQFRGRKRSNAQLYCTQMSFSCCLLPFLVSITCQ